MTQNGSTSPRNRVRLKRDPLNPCEYLWGDYRIAPSLDTPEGRGPWVIYVRYDAIDSDERRQEVEQALDEHGAVWELLYQVREVLPYIADTADRLRHERFNAGPPEAS